MTTSIKTRIINWLIGPNRKVVSKRDVYLQIPPKSNGAIYITVPLACSAEQLLAQVDAMIKHELWRHPPKISFAPGDVFQIDIYWKMGMVTLCNTCGEDYEA